MLQCFLLINPDGDKIDGVQHLTLQEAIEAAGIEIHGGTPTRIKCLHYTFESSEVVWPEAAAKAWRDNLIVPVDDKLAEGLSAEIPTAGVKTDAGDLTT